VPAVPKMAPSPAEVVQFLRDLARRARPYAEKDVADLRTFAAEHLGWADPQPWDWPYISEKLKEARYAFSEQELKEYFTAPKVLALYDAPVGTPWDKLGFAYTIMLRNLLGHFDTTAIDMRPVEGYATGTLGS